MNARRRLGRDDWAEAALDALAKGGVEAIAVEPVARSLGATKGSFYWHFSDRDELVRAACERWETRGNAILDRIEATTDARRRLPALLADPEATLLLPVESALHADPSHTAVAAIAARVRLRRLRFLRKAYEALGADRPAQRSIVAYAFFIGLLHLFRHAPDVLDAHDPVGLAEHLRDAAAFLIPAPRATGGVARRRRGRQGS